MFCDAEKCLGCSSAANVGWGVSLCETDVCLLLFGVAKSNQKLLVAEKASAFIAKRSLQKQNSSPFRTPQTVVFVTLPYSI